MTNGVADKAEVKGMRNIYSRCDKAQFGAVALTIMAAVGLMLALAHAQGGASGQLPQGRAVGNVTLVNSQGQEIARSPEQLMEPGVELSDVRSGWVDVSLPLSENAKKTLVGFLFAKEVRKRCGGATDKACMQEVANRLKTATQSSATVAEQEAMQEIIAATSGGDNSTARAPTDLSGTLWKLRFLRLVRIRERTRGGVRVEEPYTVDLSAPSDLPRPSDLVFDDRAGKPNEEVQGSIDGIPGIIAGYMGLKFTGSYDGQRMKITHSGTVVPGESCEVEATFSDNNTRMKGTLKSIKQFLLSGSDVTETTRYEAEIEGERQSDS